MADLSLSRPAAGLRQVVQSAAEGRIVLDFPVEQAVMEKEGDNLVFRFNDGGVVELENFYSRHSAESIPEFVMDGQIIAGADFFNAFGADIVPAAGPGGAASANRYHAYDNMNLADGINHLNELDWGMRTAAEYTERLEQPGAPDLPTGIGMSWGNSWTVPPTSEDRDNSAAYAEGGRFILKESHLVDGTRYDPNNGPVSASSILHVTTERSEFTGMTINGVTYNLDRLAEGVQVGIDMDGDGQPDVFVNFVYVGGNNVEVTVTLDHAVSHVDDLGNALDEALRDISLTVHDNKGNSASSNLSVTVVDDNPEAYDDYQKIRAEDPDGNNIGGEISGNVVTGEGNQGGAGTGADKAGADLPDHVDWKTDQVGTTNAQQKGHEQQNQDTGFELVRNPDGSWSVLDTGAHVPDGGNRHVGDIILKPDGSYTFTLDPAYEPEHGSHTIDIPYTLTDRDGDKADAALHITIENVNDRPRITGGTGGDVKETGVWAEGERTDVISPAENKPTVEGGLADGEHRTTVSGQLDGADADNDRLSFGAGEPHQGQSVIRNPDGSCTIHDPYGDLTVNPDGSWSFRLNHDAADHLGEGDNYQIRFPVTITDNSGAANAAGTGEITINIHGTNDAPKLNVGENLTIGEDRTISTNPDDWKVGGAVTATDVDDGHELTFGFEHGGKSVSVLYVIPDGKGGYSFSETEPADGNYYGKLEMSTSGDSGNYTFILNNNADCVQALNEGKGEGLHVDIPLVVQDEHGAYDRGGIGLTITGKNDNPWITGGLSGAVKEDGVYAAGERDSHIRPEENKPVKDGGIGQDEHQNSFEGKLTAGDIDDPQSSLTFGPQDTKASNVTDNGDGSYSFHGKYGDLTINPDGSWKYALDETRAQGLAEGQTVTEDFPVRVTDGHGGTGDGVISVDVRGTNDAPMLSLGDTDLHIKEGVDIKNNTSVSGQAVATDVDEGAQLTFGLEGPNGHVVNTLYVVPDGAGGYVLSETAPDNGDYYGAFTIDADGRYTFTVNNSADCVDRLNVDDHPRFEITVVTQDEHGAYDKGTVGVTIDGANDSPKITGGASGAVKEDGVYGAGERVGVGGVLKDGGHGMIDENAAVKPGGTGVDQHQPEYRGQLSASDVDDSASSLTFGPKDTGASNLVDNRDGSWTIHGKYGDLTINKDGSYTYRLDEDKAQSLAEGQKDTEDFPVLVTDPHGGTGGGTISINVIGTNDAPAFTSGVKGVDGMMRITHEGVSEDATGKDAVVIGRVQASDPDAGETQQLSYSFQATDGTVQTTLYAVPDGKGGVIFQPNQPADGNYYGRFTIDPKTGEYKFELNSSAKCTQALGEGENLDVTVPVVVQDPHGAYDRMDVNIPVVGADDKASIDMNALNPSQTVIEAGVLPGGNIDYAGQPFARGTLMANDPDEHDELIYKVQDKDGKWHNLNEECKDGPLTIETEHGSVIFTDNGKGGYDYVYTLDNKDDYVNALDRQEKGGDGFKVEVDSGRRDDQGNLVIHDHVNADVDITIVGTNDRPVIVDNEITIALKDPDNAVDGVFGGKISVFDPDKGHHGNTDAELADGRYNLTVTGEGGRNFVDIYEVIGHNPDGSPIHGRVVGYAEISPDGSYKIVLNDVGNSLVRDKAEGEYLEVSTSIRVTDPEGAYSETDVTWRLEGKDDAPTFSGPSVGMTEDGWLSGRPVIPGVDEDGNPTLVPNPNYKIDDHPDRIGGTLAAGRVDKTDEGAGDFTFSLSGDTDGDGHMFVIMGPNGKPTVVDFVPPGADMLGEVTVKPDGAWEFVLNQNSNAINQLRPGETLPQINIPVHVEDGRGYGSDSNISITVNGTNDRPDIDSSDKLTLDQSRGPNGEYLHDHQSYVVIGTAVASDPDNVVYGNNGNPGGSTDDAGKSENIFCFIDPVTGQPTQTLKTEHGTVTINSKTGEYTYTYDVFNDANYDPPNGADGVSFPARDQFDVYVRDKSGAYSEKETVTVDIGPHEKWGTGGPGGHHDLGFNGMNSSAREDNGDTHGKGDAHVEVIVGTATNGNGYYFVDASGNKVQSIPAYDGEGHRVGTFIVDPINGECRFVLDNGSDYVQRLDGSDEIKVSPPVVHDHAGNHPVQLPDFTLKGTADAPEFIQEHWVSSITEDAAQNGGYGVCGRLKATDVDEMMVKDANGNPVLVDGRPVYEADRDHLTFKPGAAEGGKVSVVVRDPVTGHQTTQEMPRVEGPAQDGSYTVHGKYGDLVIKPGGEYTYTVRDGVNVPRGSHGEDFKVDVWDNGVDGKGTDALSDGATIHIDLNGLNTAPVYEGDPLKDLSVREDVFTSADGKYVVAGGQIDMGKFYDADGDHVKLAVSPDKNHDGHADGAGGSYAVGRYGTLFIKPDGSYEYRLNNNMGAVQGLKDGEYLEDSFVVIGDDGYGGKIELPVNVRVEGTNDNPVLSLNDATGKQYGGGVSLDLTAHDIHGMTDAQREKNSVGGKAVATDVDTSDTNFEFSFGKDSAGKIITEVDARAVINGVDMIVGKFVIDSKTGDYRFIPNENLDHLKAGEHLKVTAEVTVESSDAGGHSGGTASSVVTVNITGTNDAPRMDAVQIDKKEDSGDYVAQGRLTAYDPDADPGDRNTFAVQDGGDVHRTGPNTWNTRYGTITLSPDGSYTYTLDNNKVQYLSEGEKADDVISVIVKDQYGASSESTITVTVTGTNDRPVLDNITAQNVQEGARTWGSFHATDADKSDVLTYAVAGAEASDRDGFDKVVHGKYGDLYYNSKTGAYQYDADNAEQLSQGEKVQDQFTVTARDDSGAVDDTSADKTLIVNITGTNQAPTLEPVVGFSTTEGDAAVAGKFVGHDVDAKDVLTYVVAGAVADSSRDGFDMVRHGSCGDLYYNSKTGAYRYEAGRGLSEGDSGKEDFTVTVRDNHGAATEGQHLEVTVTGTNDAPTLNAMTASVKEGGAGTGTFNGHDVDAKDVLTYSVAVNGHQAEQYLSQEHPGFDHRIMGEYGTLYFNSVSGAYEYVADNADALFEGDKAQDYFAVTVTDNHGASSDNNLIVEITGTNDAPLINVESHSLDTDMTYSASLTGSIVFSDVDSPRESLVLSVGGEEIKWDDYVIHGKYGDLTVNKDGTYTYEVKDMDALANAGPEGLREDFSARVDDDGNAYSEANFSITVTHNSIGVVGDAIVGTAGNDVLQVGHHDVYGGGGNDVFVVTQDSGQVNVNGGPGLDVMLITPEFDGDVDDLLARTHNVEVVVKGLDAAAANDLTSVGIVVDDRGLSLSSDWMVGAPDANGYQTYINSSGGELTVALGVSVSLESEQSTQTIQQHIITAG